MFFKIKLTSLIINKNILDIVPLINAHNILLKVFKNSFRKFLHFKHRNFFNNI